MTTDKNIRHQQNLKNRRIAIIVLGNSQRPAVEACIDRVIDAVNQAASGCYTEVEIPLNPK